MPEGSGTGQRATESLHPREAVPDTADGLQEARHGRVIPELSAHIGDMNLDGPPLSRADGHVIAAEGAPRQCLLGHDAAWGLEYCGKQLELRAREVDGTPVDLDCARVDVHHEMTVHQSRVPLRLTRTGKIAVAGGQSRGGHRGGTRGAPAGDSIARTAQHRLDTSTQLPRPEGFGDVIIGSGLQPEQRVDFLGSAGEHDQVGAGEGADLTGNLEAVDIRQSNVQGGDHRVNRPNQSNAFSPTARGMYRKTGLGKGCFEKSADICLILDDDGGSLLDHDGDFTHCSHYSADMPSQGSAGRRDTAGLSRFAGAPRKMPRGPVTIFGHHLPFGATIFAVLLATLSADLTMLASTYFFSAMVLAVMATSLSAILPWDRLPPWCPVLLALCDMAVVALLEMAGASFAVLLVLPTLWLAMTYRAAGAVLATIAGSLAAWAPELITWTAPATAEAFESRHLLIPLVLVATSAYICFAERRSDARSALLARQSALVEEALAAIDDRETLLRGILDTIDVGVIALNAEGRITHMNRSMSEIMDCTVRQGDHADKLDAHRLPRVRHGQEAVAVSPLLRVSRGEEIDQELTDVTGPGRTRRTMRVSATQIHDDAGVHTGAVVAYQDVTTENNALAQREEFVSAVSHELRTPLTSILGYLELASSDPAVPELPRSYLTVASRNADRLERLISDLLTAASGDLDVAETPVDLREIAAEAVAAHQLRGRDRQITVSFEAPAHCVVLGDRTRLAQVCDNLLSNAVKYSRDGGTIDVTLVSTDEQAILTVKDDGVGIAAEDQGQIFDRFYRSTAARRSSVPGTGLGLHISRRLVEAQHGTMVFSSSEGSGTTFVVTLPREGL